MQFHDTIKPLHTFIGKLQFSEKHHIKQSAEYDDGGTFDVVTRTSCNDLWIEDFKAKLDSLCNDVLSHSKEHVEKLGTYYQKEILTIVLHVDRLENQLFENGIYKGICTTIPGKDLFADQGYQLGSYEYDKIEKVLELKEEFYAIITDQLDLLKSDLSELLFNEKEEVKPITKLEWNTSADNLGLLLIELCKKGWIEIPRSKGEPSMRKLSFVCSDIFDFYGSKGPKTGTQRSLENVVTGQTLQSEIKTKLLDIPSPDQL